MHAIMGNDTHTKIQVSTRFMGYTYLILCILPESNQ